MKLQLFLFFSIFSINFSISQIGFEEHNIYNNDDVIYFFNNVEYFDIEGDGDLDVFIQTADKLGWYENLDGLGNFSRLKLIPK